MQDNAGRQRNLLPPRPRGPAGQRENVHAHDDQLDSPVERTAGERAAFNSRSGTPRSRFSWFSLCKLALAVVVCTFVVRSLGTAWRDLETKGVTWSGIRWQWVGASLIAYLAGMLPMGVFWYRVLWAVGEQPTFFRTLQAYYISHLGKYVPGKVTVVLLRMSVLQGQCHSIRLVTLSVFVETLTMMAVGAACGAIFSLSLWYADPHHNLSMLAVAVALLAIAGIPTAPPLLRIVLHILTRVKNRSTAPEKSIDALNGRLIGLGWLMNLPGWFLLGISFWAALRSLPIPEVENISFVLLPRLTASVGLSVVAGFVSLLPGGAFVREWVLQELMSPAVGTSAAIIAAIWLRLIWLGAEAGIAAAMAASRLWHLSLKAAHPRPASRTSSFR
ncbi:MAG: lysylphosphatidylglycerol synthase transmembrane domain-containing protein [Planctomycetota bacterium]|nr:lysylphosphatidylglycerol synthase transmembrane domain-containing protein [Planctomycetota bacterium]MDA1177826.1 lysylphosphatidylglycerol synthase transmembrane domain-containing protein [Planctomycetota bacterium]